MAPEIKKTVISLGGSLIVPNEIDSNYLRDFTNLVRRYVSQGHQFYLVAGGGATARRYIEGAKATRGAIGDITDTDADWLGIHSTRLNAHLIRTLFKDIARPEIVTNPHKKVEEDYPVIVGAGYRPGNSTDWIAVKMAQVNGSDKVINLSNIDYAYTADPKKDSTAKRIQKITWKKFREIVGDKWVPGMNAPFDPIASILAEEYKMKVIIANGHNLRNLENILSERRFRGTRIYPTTSKY